jgi:hypothetical protein
MNFSDYTPDRICQALGLPDFALDPTLWSGPPAIRFLLKPSFDPELCVTVALSTDQALLQIAALADQLWTAIWNGPSPSRRPAFVVETHEISTAFAQELVSNTMSSLATLRGAQSPPKYVVLDGMPLSYVRIQNGEADEGDGNASAGELGSIVAEYVELAFAYATDFVCRRALSSAGRYVGLELPEPDAGQSQSPLKLLVLGDKPDTDDVINALRARRRRES